MVAHASASGAPRWQAGLDERRVYVKHRRRTADGETKTISRPLDLCYVILRRDDMKISFCITRPKGRLTFSDRRECLTGTAGSTGQWGTRPASKPGKRRTLTPTAWVAEVSRLIGRDRAEEIVRKLGHSPPF